MKGPFLKASQARLTWAMHRAEYKFQECLMPILQWLSRDKDLRTAASVPFCLVEEVERHGNGCAKNMIIQGDNLHALKALLPYSAGRVKRIYIDPPYNTRSAFEHYDDNLEHTQWLAMMYPPSGTFAQTA